MLLNLADEPIVLVGQPRRCAGLARLHNPRAEAVALRSLSLRTRVPSLGGSDGEAGVVQLKVASVSRAHEPYAQIKLRLPEGTPPGRYEGVLEAAEGRSHPVVIHVQESRRLRLWPPSVTHAARAGETITVRSSILNRGNVPYVIPERAPVELYAGGRGWRGHFHAAAKSSGEQGHQAFLDEFVKRVGQDELGFARARVLQGAGSLAPQEGRALEIEFELPKKLKGRRTYGAALLLGDVRLRIALHLEDDPKTPINPE